MTPALRWAVMKDILMFPLVVEYWVVSVEVLAGTEIPGGTRREWGLYLTATTGMVSALRRAAMKDVRMPR